MSYPITENCNFESRDDAVGKAVHAAVRFAELRPSAAANSGLATALEELEETLAEWADVPTTRAADICSAAERAVADEWAKQQADEKAVEAAIVSILGELPKWCERDDGDYVIHVSDGGEDEGTETLAELRRMLPAGWSADWTGDVSTGADGENESDIRITRDS